MDENKDLEGVELTDEELDELAAGIDLRVAADVDSLAMRLNARGMNMTQAQTAMESLAARQGAIFPAEQFEAAMAKITSQLL